MTEPRDIGLEDQWNDLKARLEAMLVGASHLADSEAEKHGHLHHSVQVALASLLNEALMTWDDLLAISKPGRRATEPEHVTPFATS